MSESLTSLAYLVASVLFILSLAGLSSPETARRGNVFGMIGMFIAIAATMAGPEVLTISDIVIGMIIGGLVGSVIAFRISMTALPQLVASFHSLVGLAAVLVASAALLRPDAYGIGIPGEIHAVSLVEMSLGAIVGAVTFTSSIIAFGKLQGIIGGAPLVFTGQKALHLMLSLTILAACGYFTFSESHLAFWVLVAASLLLGFLFILPIGGADMPVVVSVLNSFSGWAACGIGFTLNNHLLIITGAIVGASGGILSHIMCKGMNRRLISVLVGGFGATASSGSGAKQNGDRPVNRGSAEDACFILKNVSSVIIVPGYGMAVARAQHVLKDMADLLQKKGIRVRYAIHPVAGRMPGHMNVLLAEASVPYDDVSELDDINGDFSETDVAFVIGANDVTNPCAKTDPTSPIYGMPILDVENAQRILFIKRSLGVGYAGVDNELFYRDNTMMLFGDAKKVVESILKELNS